MAEHSQLTVRRAKVSHVSDLHCMHTDSMECIVAGPAPGYHKPSANAKKKKKKKKQKARQLVEHNTSEFMKLDKENILMKECGVKSAQCGTAVQENSHNLESAEGSEISSLESDEQYGQKIQSLESNSPKSALRGGYEQLGFGPRPKLHVKWAPSVWEPPSSIVSHTVNDNKQKKMYSKRNLKHGHKGKASYEHKNQEKRKPQRTKTRIHVKDEHKHASTQDGSPISDHEILSGSGLEDKPAVYEHCEAPEDGPVDILKNGNLDNFKCGKSTHAVSFIGSHFPRNLVYGQAL